MTSRKIFCAALAAASVWLAVSCGKKVAVGDLPDSIGANELQAACEDRAQVWSFRQSEAVVSRSVDLLFVLDTSQSMMGELGRIVTNLPAFAGSLKPENDYQIAVMLAHGGASRHSGRLFSPGSSIPRVLRSRSQSIGAIQDDLATILYFLEADEDEANGEAMMYSLTRALEPARLAEAQALGFFRPEAALSVVFVSDENDVCYPPELHGYSTFPDFAPSFGDHERIAYQRYCGGVTSERLISGLRRLKGEKPVLFGAVTHVDPSKVPHARENAIGHGQLELVRSTLNGVTVDLSEPSYSTGLAKLGDVVSTSLRLRTVFTLTGTDGILRNFFRARVDGVNVLSTYDPETATVVIDAENAGHAGSVVEVVGCR